MRRTFAWAALALATACTRSAPAPSPTPGSALDAGAPADEAAPTLRLPDDVTPRATRVDLTVDPNSSVIEGRVELDLALARPRRTVWIHASRLTDVRAEWVATGTRTAVPTSSTADGFLAVHLPRAVSGPLTLALRYRAAVSADDDRGAFTAEDGGERYLYTQLENVDARAVFPCLDEPRFKAPWALTLRIPAAMSAFSNTAPVREVVEGDRKMVEFAPTAPLPAYLVAFGVGRFEVVDGGAWGRRPTPVRVVVPRGRAEAARFAAERTGRILARLEERLDLTHPYPKLDVLVMPHAVHFAAMEHPGLITVVASWSLAPPGPGAVGVRRLYLSVMAHELAHQWFGNWVTTAWWDDIWLNEAFAEWLGGEIAAAEAPDWGFESGMLDALDGAMDLDALRTTRAVREPITTADDIENAFDSITYEKGAAVLQMFSRAIGAATFDRALRAYLREHADGVATAADVFAALDAAAGRPVSADLATFLDRSGVPRVSLEARCEGDAALLSVSVARHLADGAAPMDPPWRLPLCWRWGTRTGTVHERCATVTSSAARLPLDGCPTWLAPQAHGAGYYRAQLPPALLAASLAQGSGLDDAERVRLARDVLPLAEAGALPYEAALALGPVMGAHPSARVRREAANLWSHVALAELSPRAEARVAAEVSRLFGAEARALGFTARPGEAPEVATWRQEVVWLAAVVGRDEALTREAQAQASRWLDGRGELPLDARELALSILVARGGGAEVDRVLARLRKETDPAGQRALTHALHATRDPAAALRVASVVLDPSLDPRQTTYLLEGGRRTANARTAWILDHADELLARLPDATGWVLFEVMERACSADLRARVQAFGAARGPQILGGPRAAATALESIDHCLATRPRVVAAVEAWAAAARPK